MKMRNLCPVLALMAMALFFPLSLTAFTGEQPLADLEKEARAKALFREIRCVVCEGQALAESNADLAQDMRHLIRQRIAAGESDEAVRRFLTSRYGEAVLLTPPRDARTAVLWYLPFALLLAGVLLFFRKMPAGKGYKKSNTKHRTRRKR